MDKFKKCCGLLGGKGQKKHLVLHLRHFLVHHYFEFITFKSCFPDLITKRFTKYFGG